MPENSEQPAAAAEPEPGPGASRSSPGAIAHAHDLYFRFSLQRRDEQVALVRALFPGLAARVDAEAFETDDGTYIDEGLQERQSDVLLRTRVAGRDLLVYFLVEHQRTVDGLMALRMIRYQTRIWDRHLARNPTATRLPVILPVVVYQGDRVWTAATDLGDLFDVDPETVEEVGEYLPRARYRLDDLTRVDGQGLRARSLTPQLFLTFTMLMRAAGNAQVADLFEDELSQDLAAVYREATGIEYIRAMLTYIMSVADVATDRLMPIVTRLGPDAVEVLMTTAERLKIEGRLEGRIEGEVRGRAEQKVETLLHLLAVKFDPLPEDVVTRVRTASGGQLDNWTERILFAATLDDVFG